MSKIKALDDLFDTWQEKHSLENSVLCQNTFPEIPEKLKQKYGELDVATFKNNWTIDGCLSDKDKCEILLILKEPNIEELSNESLQ